MRRTVLLLAGVLLSGVVLGSDAPKEYDDKTEVDSIEGTWRQIEVEFDGNGKKFKPDPECVIGFRSGTFTSNYSDGDTDRGSYRIDNTCKPPHLDWMPFSGLYRGKTLQFICQIDGDTLRIAYRRGVEDKVRRPQGFSDDDIAVKTYKRVK
jgi:uncharacterized protein (TIGR03067 family)